MSTSTEISAKAFRAAMILASDRMCEARDELGALDAAAGDGDLGATLAIGFAYVRELVQKDEGDNLGALLVQTGAVFAQKAPSTMGALLATAFAEAGRQLDGVSAMTTAHVTAMLDAAAKGVAERGKVTTGQRTVLDAMVAAAEAAGQCQHGPVFALRQAATSALAAAEATADMEPQVGRAGWIRERARGHADAGATAWATFLSGLADGLLDE
jgi:dihydroxyacetone kinase-like protein